MSNDVEVTFSAKDQGVVAYLQKQQSEILKNQETLIKLGNAGRNAGKSIAEGNKEAEASLGSVAGKFLTVAAGIGVAQKAVQGLTFEYRTLKEAQDAAAKAQTDRAGALRNASFALGNDPTMNPAELEQNLEGISQRTGVSVRDLAGGAADVLSARGDQSPAAALTALEAAARLAPDQTGNLGTFAASALDISKATGQTAMQALGQILSVGTASRVTNLKGLTENVAPGLIGLTKFGDDPRAAGALIAAVSQGGVDPTGATSRTSSISLAAQLEEFLPNLKSTSERLSAVQGDEKLREQFLDKASFEKPFIPVARGLLSGDANSPERRAYTAAMGTITQGPEAEAGLNELLGKINNLDAVRSARIGFVTSAAQERLQSLDSGGAEAALSREGLQKILAATGASGFSQQATLSAFEASSLAGTVDPIGELAMRLEATSNAMLQPGLPAGGAAMGPTFPTNVQPSDLDQARSAELKVVADLLREIRDETRRGNDQSPARPPLSDPGRPPSPRPSSALAKS